MPSEVTTYSSPLTPSPEHSVTSTVSFSKPLSSTPEGEKWYVDINNTKNRNYETDIINTALFLASLVHRCPTIDSRRSPWDPLPPKSDHQRRTEWDSVERTLQATTLMKTAARERVAQLEATIDEMRIRITGLDEVSCAASQSSGVFVRATRAIRSANQRARNQRKQIPSAPKLRTSNLELHLASPS